MARKAGTAGKAKVLTEAEFNRVLNLQKANDRTGQRNTLILYLSFYLGLRVKEIAGLKIADVFNADGSIKPEITLKVTKGGKIRQAYLTNPKLISLLQQHLKNRQEAKTVFSMEQPLIMSERGGAFSPNSLQQLFSRIFKEAGIEDASSHSGRRSFATTLISNGADIKSVQHLMGHSSINTTARYLQENPERLQKMMANFKPCGEK